MATHVMVQVSIYCPYSFFDNVGKNIVTYATKHERKMPNGKTILYYMITVDHLKLAGISAPEHIDDAWAFSSRYITEV